MTRSSVTLSRLTPTSNGGAEIVAYVFERPERLSPTWTHVVRVRPQTDANLAEKTDCQFRVCVKNVEICQTDGHQIVFTADESIGRQLTETSPRMSRVRCFSIS